MKKKIRVAIVGLGVVGSKRKFFLLKNRKYIIKYVSDIKFKKQFTRNKITYYKNYKDIPFENIDAVFISLQFPGSKSFYLFSKKIFMFSKCHLGEMFKM